MFLAISLRADVSRTTQTVSNLILLHGMPFRRPRVIIPANLCCHYFSRLSPCLFSSPSFPHRSINRLHFPDLSLRGAMAISPPFPIISARLSLTVAPRLHQASQCPVYTMSTTAIIIGEARLLNRAIQRRLLQVPPRVASCSGDTS